MKNKPFKLACGGLFLSAFAVAAPAQTARPEAVPAAAQQQAPSQGQLTREQRGFTRPSQTAKLSPMFPGIVRELKVKKGDRVKIGDVLLVQDDRIEIERLKGLKLEADSSVRIEAAQTDMEAKKKALERVRQMYKNGASSDLELEQAELEFDFRVKQIQLAELEKSKAKTEADAQALRIEQMRLLSQVDGIVERIEVAPGEMTNPEQPLIWVVTNDPLEVELHLPAAAATKLKLGDKMDVRYPDETAWKTAEVSYLSPVVNSKGGTREVRLRMPNAELRETGLQVIAKVPDVAGPGAAETAAVTPAR